MKLGLMFFRFGALGLLFAPGVFFEEPVKSYLAENHSSLTTLLLLYGFPVLVGFTFLVMTEGAFRQMEGRFALLFKALSALTFFWFALWWAIWGSMNSLNNVDLFIKYMTYLNIFGLALGLTFFLWAWKTSGLGKRTARFTMAAGWMISYTSAIELHVQPTLRHLMGPGIGGLLLLLGAVLISQDLD